MSDWRPRAHDHLVEPVFGGLGAHHERDPHEHERAREQRARKRLAFAALAALLIVAARAAALLFG